MKLLRLIVSWVVFNIPMGRLAPYLLGFALGSRGKRIKKQPATPEKEEK